MQRPGGTFRMGSDEFHPEERPVRAETVGRFVTDVWGNVGEWARDRVGEPPAARQLETVDTSTSHIGLRCVTSAPA